MKAVIKVGGKQYIVAEKETLLVDKLDEETKTLTLEPLLLFDEAGEVQIGMPTVKGASVEVKVLETLKDKKIIVGKFQAKKRVKKMQGHRQDHTRIEIISIK
ncbi:MAG TPA: 50S ribosomal protein L21 [Patescibacteria group bacterium]|jgi:large subunit ribosomal protein L21|nr:50S ribosomal protein L21 [Patescibacteria group bacterium]